MTDQTAMEMTDQTAMESIPATKPSGPAAAAFVAAGIGSLVLGLMVSLAEFSTDGKNFLDFAKNYGLGNGVGPLSGKVIVAVLAYVISWAVLFFMWRGKEISVRKAFLATIVLVGLGFALTFPPIFTLLAPAA
ncbi:MAG: hypothetical protein ABI725_01715 [Chloroflexota bacterium]